MVTNHWGKWVDSEIPTTGVFQTNICEFVYEDAFNGVDLSWEEHLKSHDDVEDHEDCYTNESPNYLIGYRKDSQGLYEPDPEAEYSAIVRGENNVTQVTASKWVIRCALCSPCYPGQGNGDSEGDYLAFAIPPDVVGDTCPELKARIFKYEPKGGEKDGSI